MKYFLFLLCIIFPHNNLNAVKGGDSIFNSNNLIAYYPFNGNTEDESGNGNHGTARFGATLTSDRFGNVGKAFAFNGNSAYIFVANSPSLESPVNEIAVTGWIFINSWDNGFAPFICKTIYSNSPQYEVLLNETFIGFYSSNPNISSTISYNFQLSQWYFIAISWDGTIIKTYINNILTGSVNTSGTLIPDTSSLSLGVNTPGVVEHLNGSLDDIRIYNRAISGTEIQQLYNEGLVTLFSPGNNSQPGYTINTLTPAFLWGSVPSATNYELQLYKKINDNYELHYITDNITNNLFYLPAGFITNNSQYYWRVRAKVDDDWTTYSSIPYYFNISYSAQSPMVFLSSSVLQVEEVLGFSGNNFSLNNQVQVNISSNTGFDTTFTLNSNNNGSILSSISFNTPGNYSLNCRDVLTNIISSQKSFEVRGTEGNTFNITIPHDGYQGSSNNAVMVSWGDKLVTGPGYPVNTNQREYKYIIELSSNGGESWEAADTLSGFDDINKTRTFSKFILIGTGGNYLIRVSDDYASNRVTGSVSIQVASVTPSDLVIDYVWDDYSYSTTTGKPVGVVTDGVSRFYIKVSDPGNTISSVTFTLSDAYDNPEPSILGKVMGANDILSYSTEANDANQVEAQGVQHTDNTFWCWYVAPDDFLNNNIPTSLKAREVTIKIKAEYANGEPKEETKTIIIQRPPVMLVHGLYGSPASWENYMKISSPFSWKYDTRTLIIGGKASYNNNAERLLSVTNNPEYSLPDAIMYYRNTNKLACNQVYYIGHSMGGTVLRYAETHHANNFFNQRNYGKGYVNKFITLATPHRGSPIANLAQSIINFVNSLSPILKKSKFVNDHYINEHGELYTNQAIKDLRMNIHHLNSTSFKSHVFVADILNGEEPFWQVAANMIALSVEFGVIEFIIANPAALKIAAGTLVILGAIDAYYSIFDGSNSITNSDLVVPLNSQLSNLPLYSSNSTYTINSHTSIKKNTAEFADILLNKPLNLDWWGHLPQITPSSAKVNDAPIFAKIMTDTLGIEILTPVSFDTLYIDSTFNISFSLTDTVNLKRIDIIYQDKSVIDTIAQFNYNFTLNVSSNFLDTQYVVISAYYLIEDSIKISSYYVPIIIKTNDIPTELKTENKFVYLLAGEDYYLDMNLYFPNYISKIGTNGTNINLTLENNSVFTYDNIDKKLTAINNGDTYAIVEYNNLYDTIYFKVRGEENPVPVELLTFSAIQDKENINLTWTTHNEVNNYGFEIELNSPLKGNDWEKIGFIAGHGNSYSPKQYSFSHKAVVSGHYSFRLKQIDTDGDFEYSKVIEIEIELLPKKYALHQNYPNPFNPITTIKYSIPYTSSVKIFIYDVLGNQVKQLVNEVQESSNYEIDFNAELLASGVYFYTIQANSIDGKQSYVNTKKMMLLK